MPRQSPHVRCSGCTALWQAMHAFPVGAQRCGRRCTHFQWVRSAVGGDARISSGCIALWWCSAGAVKFLWCVRAAVVVLRGRCHFFPVGSGRCGGAARALSFSSSGCGVTVCGAVFFFQWVRAAVVALHGRCHFFSSGFGPLWVCCVGPVGFSAAGAGRCGALRSAPGARIPGYPAPQLQTQITRATGLAEKSGVYAYSS